MNPNVKLVCQMVISLAVIIPFWFIAYGIIFHGGTIDPSVREISGDLISSFVPLVAGIAGFWVGSSLSSASKDHVITQALDTASTSSTSKDRVINQVLDTASSASSSKDRTISDALEAATERPVNPPSEK